jgi:hypothetical protein
MRTPISSRAVRGAVATLIAAAALYAPFAAQAQQAGETRRHPWKNQTSYEQIAEGPWTGPRLPDGQPDVTGHWSNTIANHNNFEDPQGGEPGNPSKVPREQRAPSRVTDPPDGRIPYQPWARAKQQEFAKNFPQPEEQRFIEPLARCAPAGVPKSFYWHGYELRQYPGYVFLLFGSGSRLIHLDGKPHLPEHIKLWNADSRGRWEGNTLVVDVRNNNAKALFGRHGNFASDQVRIEERYVFSNDGKRFNYVVTFDDPNVYTRRWTATVPMRRWTEADIPHNWHYEVEPANTPDGTLVHEKYEQTCVENNGPFGGGAVGVPGGEPIISR